MLFSKRFTQYAMLGLFLAILAVFVFAMALDGPNTVDAEWPATGSAYFSERAAESTGSPVEIAGCNGGASGGWTRTRDTPACGT